MNAKNALRAAVVAQLLLTIVSIALSFSLDSALPPQLQEYIKSEEARELTSTDVVLLPILLGLLASTLIASIALLFTARWARWLYLINVALGTAMMPFLGPNVAHAVTTAADEAAIALSGVVLGIAFFGDVMPKKQVSGEWPVDDETGWASEP